MCKILWTPLQQRRGDLHKLKYAFFFLNVYPVGKIVSICPHFKSSFFFIHNLREKENERLILTLFSMTESCDSHRVIGL